MVEAIETRLKVFDESFERQRVILDTVEGAIAKVAILCQQHKTEWRAAKETIQNEFGAEADALLHELAEMEASTEGAPETKGLERPESSLPDVDAPSEGEALSQLEVASQLEQGPQTREAASSQPINDGHEASPTPSAVRKAPPQTADEVRADSTTPVVNEAPRRTEEEVRGDPTSFAVDEAPRRSEDEVQALHTTSTVDETSARTEGEVQALPTSSNFDGAPPRTVDNVQKVEKQSPGSSEAPYDTGEQWQGAAGLVPSGIFFVAFDSSESLGFGIALMRDKMRGTAHVIVDKIFDPRPSAGQLKILDELVAIGDMRVGTISSMSQFYRIVEQIRRSPRPIVLMFHRSDRRYLQANCVSDPS